MPDAEAVEQFVTHRYFRAHGTPLQILNRATDPFLPAVRPHTLAVLADLDARGLRNHVLVITRHQMKPSDIGALSRLVNIKLTLLFTYSGIDGKRIEPYPSHVAAGSLTLMSAPSPRRYRTILYWRTACPNPTGRLHGGPATGAAGPAAGWSVARSAPGRRRWRPYCSPNGPRCCPDT